MISQFPERSYSLCYLVGITEIEVGIGVIALNSLNGVIAYATIQRRAAAWIVNRINSQFPERSYSLCYQRDQEATQKATINNSSQFPERSYSLCYEITNLAINIAESDTDALNSLNGVIAYATL